MVGLFLSADTTAARINGKSSATSTRIVMAFPPLSWTGGAASVGRRCEEDVLVLHWFCEPAKECELCLGGTALAHYAGCTSIAHVCTARSASALHERRAAQ